MLTALAYSKEDFCEAQARMGLSDDALGKLLYRGDIGAAAVRAFRSGDRSIPAEIAFAMTALEREFGEARAAA